MLTLFALALMQSFMVATFSYIYVLVLTKPDHFLSGLYIDLDTLLNYGGSLGNSRTNRFYWLFRILIGCEICNAGWISMLTFPLLIQDYGVAAIPFHLFSVVCSMLFVLLLKKTKAHE